MAFKPIALGSASMFALMLAGAAQAQTAPAAAPQAEEEAADIVVTGVRASIVGAINVRKEAVQIVDSIVAEDVGKLPDNNVIEALQRVTGIQVTNRTGGEAAAISIRGLPDALTTLNGRNIFTASGQAFALQDLSANLIRQVDVYKTRAADQIETGLAGQIDVKTRRPFDFDGFAISALARGIYNEEADTYNPNAALLVSNRWETGIGDIGILINGSYTRTKFRDMTTTAGAMVPFATENPPAGSGFTPLQRIFSGWQPGQERGLPTAAGSTLNINGVDVPYYLSRDAIFSSDLYGKRERPAFNVAVQWAPNDSSEYTAEMFYNGFKGSTFNSLQFSFADWWGSLGPNPGSTFELYDGTNIIKSRRAGDVFGFNSGDFSTNKTDSYVYALNGKWNVGERGKIVADLAYQTSTNKTSFIAMRTTRVAKSIDVDFNAGGGIPSYHFDDDALLADPSQWTIGEFYDNANKSKGSALTFMLDGDYEWDEGFIRKISGGFRYDDRKARDSVRTQDAGGLGANLSTLPADALFTNSGFYDGRADIPTSWVLANGYWLSKNADTIRQLYKNDPRYADRILLSDQMTMTDVFDINEVTLAAYLQADAEVSIFGRPLQLQAGVRFVAVDTNFTFVDRYSTPPLVTQAASGTERFLPSFTARYDIFDNLRLRFNYGETLRRPGFADLNPNYTLTGDLTNVGYGTGGRGNPALRPTTSKNFDLALEWYFERSSAIYATLFRREIDGLVVPITSLTTVPGSGLNTNSFLITRPENASDGVLKGVELGLTYFPTYLPGPLKGLGFQGSLTILDSKQNIPLVDINGNVTGQTTSSFFGVSDLSYNATLAYERGPIGARLSYVWRKEFLANNEARLFANPIGVWRAPEKSLDFQLTAKINDSLGLTFDAVNLTRSKMQTYYKFEDVGGPDKFNLGTTLLARTFALGVRYTFK
ncbi:MAG TPA: TonB-dependent receptor [Sphingobium sp.]|uniref:TonB-dependent receptor n=1 Tax=unclassified Sphingobium TaxID=2611147 RepID=UPI0007F32E16|nr:MULTISPECIES: TonB-dependent receptor [unclassified Sphingobium]OAN55789.1 TonB-dependent receptor [Sphingobium sp. TCM1]HAF42997.1 TonB-dependent receptor [Sphingobium sp.]